MKADELMEAFQYLDDDIIESVDLIRKNPAPVKRNWTKWLATAACLCLILTAIRVIPSNYIGFGGASDGAVAEDVGLTDSEMADGKEEYLNQTLLTIPDYSLLIRGNTSLDHPAANDYTTGNAATEGTDSSSQLVDDALICTADVLPVYCNLSIPTSIFHIEDLGVFEKELDKITSYDIYEQYIAIDKEEAYTLLENGHYITFAKAEYSLDLDYKTELIYLYDAESDLAIPYYRFYNQKGDTKGKSFDGLFVPAISQEYITNMPAN